MCDELTELSNDKRFGRSDEQVVIISSGAAMDDERGAWATFDLREGLERVTRCINGEFRQFRAFQGNALWQTLRRGSVRGLGHHQKEKAAMRQA